MELIFYSFWLINCVFCLLLLCIDLKRYSPAAVFWLSILCFFLLPDGLDPYKGIVQAHPFAVSFNLDMDTLVTSQCYIFCVLLSCLCIYIIALSRTPRHNTTMYFLREMKNSNDRGLALLLLFLSLSLYAFLEAYMALGRDVFSAIDFTYRRESFSFIAKFLLSYNFIIVAGVFFWAYQQSRRAVCVFLLFFFIMGYFIMGGSRQPLIILLLPFFFYFLFQAKKPLLWIGCFVISSIVIERLLRFLIFLRNLPGFSARLDGLLLWSDQLFMPNEDMNLSESNLRFAFYYFIKTKDQFSDFGQFTYFKRLLLFWMPSSLDVFAIKPPDFEYQMFAHYMPGYEGSMHPSFFGSIYADSGWLFMPWMAFFIALLFFANYSLKFYKGPCFFAIWGLWAYAFMMMARGALYGPFVILMFGLVLVNFAQKIASISLMRTGVLR